MPGKLETLSEIIAPAVAVEGYEFVGLEYLGQGKHSLLRIYIDTPQGITITDCEKVSRQVSAVLDVAEPITGEYTLEVSSPGLDRPFFTLEQMNRFVGKAIKIRLHIAQNGQKNFSGKLVAIEAENIILEIDNQRVVFPFAEVDKANLAE
jgi:ribosome maturation factor RimP